MLQTKSGCLLVIVVIPIAIFVGNSIWNISRSMSVEKKYDLAMVQCEKYGGEQGELPIITDGVFDTRRVVRREKILKRASVFINNGLQYVEFSRDVITLTGTDVPPGPPFYKKRFEHFKYYRAYLSDKGDPMCEPFEKSTIDYFDRKALGDNACVAIEGFDRPYLLNAPYQITVVNKVINEGVEIEWNNLNIVHRRSQKVVASYNTFSHCFTSYGKNASEGFSYCRGIYSNEKVRPKCPAEYEKDARVINQFEKSAFSYERDTN